MAIYKQIMGLVAIVTGKYSIEIEGKLTAIQKDSFLFRYSSLLIFFYPII